jgi:hypothetical protein
MKRWFAKLSLALALAAGGCTSAPNAAGPGASDAGVVVHGDGAPAIDAAADGTTGAGDTTPPTFAGLLSATAIDETHIALAWNPATDRATAPGTISYRVYVGAAPGGEVFTQPMLTTPAGATGALLQGMLGGTTYYFVVRAVDAAGNEDSNTVEQSATTPDTSSPVFAGVQTVAASGATTLLATWNPAVDTGCPASAITYNVYSATASGGEDFTTPTVTTAAGALQATMSGLTSGQRYYVVVRAVDAAGNSDANTFERSARTLDTTPPTFAGVASATAEGTAVLLTWSAATDGPDSSSQYIVYDIFIATSPGAEDYSHPSYTAGGGGTSFTVMNLAASTTYYFVVRARDTSGNEDANIIQVSATTGPAAVVSPPTFAGATSATATSDSTIVLSWAAATDSNTPSADIAYDVYEAVASGAEEYGSGPEFTTPLGATTFAVTGLQPLETVYFVVRARDLEGNEDTNTVEVSAKTLSDISPPSFGGLTGATATNPESILLTWSPASDQATPSTSMTYRIYMGTSSGGEGSTPVATSIAGATSLTVTGLTPLTQYWFYARAVDAAGLVDTTPTPVQVTATPPADVPSFGGASTIASTSPTTITVGWSAAGDPVASEVSTMVYLVYVSTTQGAELSATPIMVPAPATNATITGLIPATHYYVIVRAENTADTTDTNTDELSQETEADTTPPTFAGAAGISSATATTMTVAWAAASDPITPVQDIEYLVCMTLISGDCDGTKFTATYNVTGGTSYMATGLTQDTTYYFVVRAENQYGLNDGNSVQVSGVTVQTVFPPPTFTTAPKVTAATYTTLPMSWLATVSPASTITYAVCYSTVSTACAGGTGAPGTVVPLSPTTATSVTISSLTPTHAATTYYVSVTATSQGGSTTSQSAVATLADTSAPSTPTGLTAVLDPAYPNSMGLTWVASTDPASSPAYISYVLCANSCSNTFTIGGADASVSSSFLGAQATTQGTSLASNTTYTFTIAAKDQAGNVSPASTPITATTPVSFATDIYDNIFNTSPSIAPNPCNDCHSGGDFGPTPGPYTYAFITGNLTPTPVAYGTYTECPAGLHFVLAGNLDASVMYRKMAGPNACSPGDIQMPYGGPFDAGYADVMAAWILQGAVNN